MIIPKRQLTKADLTVSAARCRLCGAMIVNPGFPAFPAPHSCAPSDGVVSNAYMEAVRCRALSMLVPRALIDQMSWQEWDLISLMSASGAEEIIQASTTTAMAVKTSRLDHEV